MNANNYILTKSLLALLTIALLAGRSLAAPILDQSQPDHNWRAAIDDEGYLAQTFTPQISDQLDHIELLIGDLWVRYYEVDYHFGPPTSAGWPATVSIVRTVGGGAPSTDPADVLGQVDVDEFFATTYQYHQDGYPVLADWNSIDFLAENVTLTAGTLYAIVISNDNDTEYWIPNTDVFLVEGSNSGDPYSQGLMWERLRNDPGDPWGTWEHAQSQSWNTMDVALKTYMVPEPAAILLLLPAALVLLLAPRSKHRTRILCISPVQS